MENNLMPKIAEMLGVKLGEYVTVENIDDPKFSWKVMITINGLEFDKKGFTVLPNDKEVLRLEIQKILFTRHLSNHLYQMIRILF